MSTLTGQEKAARILASAFDRQSVTWPRGVVHDILSETGKAYLYAAERMEMQMRAEATGDWTEFDRRPGEPPIDEEKS